MCPIYIRIGRVRAIIHAPLFQLSDSFFTQPRRALLKTRRTPPAFGHITLFYRARTRSSAYIHAVAASPGRKICVRSVVLFLLGGVCFFFLNTSLTVFVCKGGSSCLVILLFTANEVLLKNYPRACYQKENTARPPA